jgi:hypothetical protein
LSTALRERGVGQDTASLAARMAMAVFSHVATAWFARPDQDLDQLVRDTFEELRSLTAEAARSDVPSARPAR